MPDSKPSTRCGGTGRITEFAKFAGATHRDCPGCPDCSVSVDAEKQGVCTVCDQVESKCECPAEKPRCGTCGDTGENQRVPTDPEGNRPPCPDCSVSAGGEEAGRLRKEAAMAAETNVSAPSDKAVEKSVTAVCECAHDWSPWDTDIVRGELFRRCLRCNRIEWQDGSYTDRGPDRD